MIEKPETLAAAAPHRIAGWCGAAVMLMGGGVLLGQMFDFSVLSKFVSEYVNMRPNTALCFFLSGAALCLLQIPGRQSVRLARVGAGIIGGIALLTLLEYAGGWNLLIDELLVRGHGRTGVFSALCFTSLAAGLWLMSRPPGTPRRPLVVGRLGSFVLLIGLLAVLGHLGGFRIGYGWLNFTAMAMLTGSLFVLLGAALRVCAWREAEERWLIKPWITVGFVASLALLVGVAAIYYRSTLNLVSAAERVTHTHKVFAKICDLRNSISEHQSGMRGFVITGNESFLPLYEDAIPKTLNQVRELRNLTSDNAGQQQRIENLEKLIKERMQEVQSMIELRRSNGFAAAAALIDSRKGKLMPAIQAGLNEMEAEEDRLIQDRAAESQTITDRTLAILPIGTGLSLVFLSLGLLRLNRETAARQRASDELKQSDLRLRMALDAADIGEWAMNPVTLAARRSLKHDRIFGYAEMLPEWNYEMFLNHVHLEDRGRVDQAFHESIAAGRDWDFDCRIIRRDGTPGWIWARGTAVRDASGGLVEMLGMVRDITGRKQAEEALRVSEQDFRSLAEAVPQIVWATRPDGWNIYFNQKWVDYTGLTQEESRGHGWNTPFHPDDQQRASEAWQAAVEHNKPYSIECRLRRADGVYRWWLIRGAAFRDANGVIQKWFGTCTDIEDLKQAEEIVARQAAELELLYGSAAVGLFFFDTELRFVRINQVMADINGLTIEQHIGLNLREIVAPELADALEPVLRQVLETGQPIVELEVHGATAPRADEPERHWLVSYHRAVGGDGTIKGVHGVVVEITRRKQAEKQLQQNHDTFFNLIQNAPFGLYVVDAQFRLSQVSTASQKVFENVRPLIGRDFEEVIRTIWTDPFASEALARFRHTLATGEPYSAPNTVQQRNDKPDVESYDWKIERMTLPNGQFGVVCYFYDVTERNQAAEVLRQSDERYRNLLNTIDEAFSVIEVIFDEDEKPVDCLFLEVNPAFEKQCGVFNATGQLMSKAVPGMDTIWFEIYGKVALTGEPVRFINEGKSLNRWFDVNAVRVGGPGSRKVAILFTDITQRRLAESALRESEEFNRSIIESSPDCIKILDLEGNLLSMQSGQELLGIKDIKPYLNTSWIGFFEGEDRRSAQAAVQAASENGKGKFVGFFPTLLGEAKWWDVAVSPILDANGKPERLLAVSRDVTERKLVEDDIRRRTAQFEALLNAAPLGVILLDADLRIQQVNPIAIPVFGTAELVGRDYADVLHALWPKEVADAALKQFRHTLDTGEACYIPEMIEQRADRETTEYYEWQINRIPLPDGRYGVVCYFRDISERVLAQQEIRESQRFLRSSLDALSGHIAVLDEAGNILEINQAWRRFADENHFTSPNYGIGSSYIQGFEQTFPQASKAPAYATGINDVIAGRRTHFEIEYPCNSPTEQRWFIMRVTRFQSPGPVRIVIVHDNITARKRAEDELRRSEGRFRLMADSAPVLIWLRGTDKLCIWFNKT